MLNKVLLITLGGSGEKLARYLKQDVEQRLRRVDWKGGMPAAWRWLCVDVAHSSDVVTNDVPESLGTTGTRLGLSNSQLFYSAYYYQVTSNPRGLPGLAGAVPAPEVELPAPFNGAGQRPQVGHVIGLAGLRQLSDEISRQMSALSAPGVETELAAVSRALGALESTTSPKTTIIVASSLAGGSGAGLLQLTVELVLNHAQTEAHRDGLMTVLFTPDIFIDLSDRERAGVYANSLYTTSTMINGYESAGERSGDLAALLTGAGFTPDSRRRAAVTNFFVGRENGEISFDNQNAVIKSTAKAIGRMLVDDEVAKGLEAHFKTNRDGAPVSDEYRLVSPINTSRPASSLGYASISLGDAQLVDYAAERLAKAQLETFLRGHRQLRGVDEQDDAVPERVAQEQLQWFLGKAGLSRDDALGALYDRGALRDDVYGQVEKVQEDLRRGALNAPPANWLKRVNAAFAAYREELQKNRQRQLQETIDAWCERAHQNLCAAVAESIGCFGVSVTTALLAATSRYVEETASELDLERRETLAPRAVALAEKSRKTLEVKARSLRGGDSKLDDCIDARGKSVFFDEDAAYAALAADLLRGLPDGVLEPLRRCVADTAARFADGEVKRHRSLVENWSSGEIGPRLRPAPNQLLLEPVEALPGIFEELLKRTTGKAIANAEEQSVEEVLTGRWSVDGGGGEQDLIEPVRHWRHGGAAAQFRIPLDIPDLRERAERWVRYRPGAVSEHLQMPIAKWIEERPERDDVFAEALEQALRCAAPLLRINPDVHLRVHGSNVPPPKLHLSSLPIPADSHARQRVSQSLHAVGITDGEIGRLIDGSSPARTVEISSFLAQPVEPVVIESLFRPIEGDWKTRVDSSMREQFSSFRRTRPLPLFVPMSERRQLEFVSGWIAAGLLGQLSEFSGDWDRLPSRVWSPEGWLQFPSHLLGRGSVVQEEEVLGRVLESLPLALAAFSAEQYEPLRAYMRVLELGDLTSLRELVITGRSEPDYEGAIGMPPAADADGFGETPTARRQRMLERVNKQLAAVERYLAATPVTQKTVASLPPRWEVADLTLRALDRIRKVLVELGLDDDDGAAESMVPLARK